MIQQERIQAVVAIALTVVLAAAGQEKQSTMEALMDQSRRQPEGMSASMAMPPMDAPINPDTYLVGPGDLFGVSIWSSVPLNFTLPVAPEGILVIPTVGEVGLMGLSLADAKSAVVGAIKKRYKSDLITATLLRPRSVAVFVQGQVLKSGRYLMFASDRVGTAIRQANGERSEGLETQAVRPADEADRQRLTEDFASAMSTRNIVLRRRSGAVVRVDLPMFHATGVDRWNPSLTEGDEIIVPAIDGNRNSIGVFGGVNLPGRFEFVEGETLADAVILARGFNPRAIRDSVTMLRMDSSGLVFTPQVFSLATEDEIRQAAEVRLIPGDRVVVPYERELRGDEHIEVTGEIQRPGKYPIISGRTRLTDAIRMAGGFTEEALVPAGEIFRKPVEARLAEKTAALLRGMSGLTGAEDTVYFRIEQMRRTERERVSAAFGELFLRGDSSENVLLRDGDKIVVPKRGRTVYVFGQVVHPGHTQYVPGVDADEYIARVGGYLDDARSGDVLVMKVSTGQWAPADDITVEEGDMIWVPKDPKLRFTETIQVVSQVASVVSVVLSSVIIIIQLTKN
ncbi:MAG TPA: SLBB domain-containing protein [Bacteroidota bacterium]